MCVTHVHTITDDYTERAKKDASMDTSLSVLESAYRAKAYDLEDTHCGLKNQLRAEFIDECSRWRVVDTVSRFARRVTCIEWHRRYPHMVAFGSYAGDILLYDTVNSENNLFVEGEGCGSGAATQMTFCPSQPLHMYVTSLNGTFSLKDLEGKHSEIYLNTMDLQFWWTALGVSQEIIFVGGNTGRAVMLDTLGNTLHTYHRFHKGKIHHAEFCPASENILATCSNDKTVALWDVRTWGDSDSPKPFTILQHESPVTSAYFDPLYGSRLLTTTQKGRIHLYDAHNWDTPTIVMKHSHRHFQHLTDIKATWHPFYEDLCVVGRYADKEEENKMRCVDVVDLKKGVVAGRFYDPAFAQIMTVNRLNEFGSILATGMGEY